MSNSREYQFIIHQWKPDARAEVFRVLRENGENVRVHKRNVTGTSNSFRCQADDPTEVVWSARVNYMAGPGAGNADDGRVIAEQMLRLVAGLARVTELRAI